MNKPFDTFTLDAWEVFQCDAWDVSVVANHKHVCFFKHKDDADEIAASLPDAYVKQTRREYAIYDSVDQYYKFKDEFEKEVLLKKARSMFSDEQLSILGINKNDED